MYCTMKQTSPRLVSSYTRPTKPFVPPKSRRTSRTQHSTYTTSALSPHTSYIVPNHRNLAVRSTYSDNVRRAFQQLMLALLGHDVFSGGAGGSSGGGGSKRTYNNSEGFYKEIIDTLLLRKCIPCVHACLQQMRLAIDQKLVVKYTKTLFYTIDTAFRVHHGITLSSYIHNVLSRTPVSPAFELISGAQDTKYVKYFLMELVSDIIPSKLKHLEKNTVYSSIKPEILKFLAKGKGDVSMLAGAAMEYTLKAYEVEGISIPRIPCIICHLFNQGCQD